MNEPDSEERHPDAVDYADIPYRASHTGSDKAARYDQDFWRSGSIKAQDWVIERRLLERAIRTLLPTSPQRALDFACGTGRVLSELEAHVPHPLGVDISADMLEIARTRCTQSELICTDVTDGSVAVPALDEPFDLVTAFRFFLNAEPGLRRRALDWIRAHLSADGRLVANFHLNPNSLRGLYLRSRWKGERRMPMLSIKDVEQLLGAAGFVVEDVQGYEYLPFRREGVELLAPRLRSRVEDALFAKPALRSIAGCHLVVARAR